MTGFGIPALGAQSARDEAEIRDPQARQQEAWNRHDARAYAALFTDDGDVVNVVGWWWKAEMRSRGTSPLPTPWCSVTAH